MESKRSESFLSDIHGRDHISKAQLGFDRDNKITYLKETYANIGAYISDFGIYSNLCWNSYAYWLLQNF